MRTCVHIAFRLYGQEAMPLSNYRHFIFAYVVTLAAVTSVTSHLY